MQTEQIIMYQTADGQTAIEFLGVKRNYFISGLPVENTKLACTFLAHGLHIASEKGTQSPKPPAPKLL